MRTNCLIVTPEVQELIDKIKEIYPERYSNIVSSDNIDDAKKESLINQAIKAEIEVLSENLNGNIPTLEQLKEYIINTPNFEFDINELLFNNIDSLEQQAALAFSSTQKRLDRAIYIARVFSEYATRGYNKEVANNPALTRKSYILNNLQDIISSVYDYFNYNSKASDYINSAHKQVQDNWRVLLEEASTFIYGMEGINLSSPTDIDKTVDFEDDESSYVAKDGWMVKAREVDLRDTLSTQVRKILNTLVQKRKVREGEKSDPGTPGYITDRDDLGVPRFLNPDYAHIKLIEALSKLYSCGEFDDALKVLTKKQPWVSQIVKILNEDNNDLKALFYNDLRREFVPYWIQVDFKTKQVNKNPGIYYLFTEWRNNYESGIKLDNDSIYNERNQVIPESGKVGLDIVNKVLNSFVDVDQRDIDAIKEAVVNNIDDMQKLLAMIGIEFSKDQILDTIMLSESPVITVNDIVNKCAILFKDIQENKVSDNADFINDYDGVYTELAKIFNTIPEEATLASFREMGKTYQSYSAPSYLGRLLNGIKSLTNGDRVLLKEFGSFRQFFTNGKYRSEWLRLLQSKAYRALIDRKVVLHKDRKDFDSWTEADHLKTMVNEFFSSLEKINKDSTAWYSIPLLADAGSAEFIKFVKYVSDRNGSVESKIIPLLAEEILNEYERIRVVEKRDLDRRTGVKNSKIIYNYDILRNKDGDIKGPNGAEFKFFPVLNTWTATSDFINSHSQYYFIKEGDSFRAILDILLSNHRELLTPFIKDVLYITEKEAFNTFYTQALNTYGNKDEDGNITANPIREDSTFEEDMKEFFYNNAFAYTQIVRLTTTDLAYYKNLNDFQKRYKEIYAMTLRPYTNSKYGKKVRKSAYLKDSVIVSKGIKEIEAIINNRQDLSKLEKDFIINQYKDVNVTDAQTFITLSSYRSIMSMVGTWSQEMEDAYERLGNGGWEFKDFNIIWQTIKSFMFTQGGVDSKVTFTNKEGIESDYGRIKVPTHLKTSEAILMAIYSQIAENVAQSNILKGLNKWMEYRDIDAVSFESSIKVGNQNPISLEEDAIQKELEYLRNSRVNLNPTIEDAVFSILDRASYPNNIEDPEVIHLADYEDYGIQVATSEHLLDHNDVIGAQIKKLIEADLPDNIVIKIPIGRKNGKQVYKEFNKKELHDLYQSLLTENILDGFTEISEKFINKDGTPNYEEVSKLLKKEMEGNTRYTDEDRKACALVERNGKKVFNIPLYDPIQSERVQQILFSIIKRKVTKQTIRRATAIQATSWGLTNELQIRYKDANGNIITDPEVLDKMSSEQKQLSIAYYEAYLPAYAKDLLSFLLGDNSGNLDINKLPEELRRIIGFRTPTEAKYSMQPIYIKGFLPVSMGSVIMLPAEITTIVGSDFDVDKVLCMLPEFEVHKYDFSQAKYYYNKEVVEPNQTDNAVDNLIQSITLNSAAKERGFNLESIDDSTLNDIINDVNAILEENDEPEIHSFKKWFDENKERFEYDTPRIKVLKYDYSKPANQQGSRKVAKKKRNNAIIEVAWGVLTNEMIAPQVLKPGGFTEVSRIAALCSILKNANIKDLLATTNTSSFAEAIKKLFSYSKDQMKSIAEKYEGILDPLSPLTQMFFHQQNANGGKMIGVYAVAVSAHALGQWSNIELKNSISAFGKKFQKIDSILNEEGQLISENLSQFLGGSVDNVKDPVLRDLNQNGKTGAMTALLLRLGWNIPQVGLFMTAPLISEINPNYSSARELTEEGLAWATCVYNHKEDFNALTDKQKAIYYELLNSIKYSYEELQKSADDLKFLTGCSRGDTSNSAGGPTIGHIILRYLKLKKLQDNKDRLSINFDSLDLDYILNGKYNDLREAYNSGVPFLQAATKCGVVGPMHLVGKFFPQLNPKILDLLTNTETGLSKYMDFVSMGEEKAIKYINKFFNQLFAYILNSTEFFGKNGVSNSSQTNFKQYIMDFPGYFESIRKEFPELLSNRFIKQLKVSSANVYNAVPSITMSNIGKVSTIQRGRITRDWEALLSHPEERVRKLAIQLFKYGQFYGLAYSGPNRFIQYAPNTIKELCPDYLSCLEDFVETANFNLQPFINQFIRNNIAQKDFRAIIDDKSILDKSEDTLIIKGATNNSKENFLMYINSETHSPEFYQLVELNKQANTSTYVRVFPLGVTNEILEYYYREESPESAINNHLSEKEKSQYATEGSESPDYEEMGYTVVEEDLDYSVNPEQAIDFDSVTDANNQIICR